MKNFTVYIHEFPNGKKYVGITCLSVDERWKEGKGYKNQPVYNAINKYGWNNIKHKILFTHLSKCDAETIERKLIKELYTNIHENGYNVEDGGYHKGTVSKEIRDKISASCKGKKHRCHKRSSSKYRKPVICIETGETFSCAKEAQENMKIDAHNIKRCCQKQKYYKTAGGYHWKYADKGVTLWQVSVVR